MNSISEIISPTSNRPLLVCDVDEVVLEFLTPFQNFLIAQDKELRANSFALHGNVFDLQTDIAVQNHDVTRLIENFFADQSSWQMLLPQVHQVLNELHERLDIVFLTAMPPHHFSIRKKLLESFDLLFPLLATEKAKGPILQEAHSITGEKIFFVDDMIFNHHSVAEYAPDTHHISIMANKEFKAIAPKLDEYIYDADTWSDIKKYILNKF